MVNLERLLERVAFHIPYLHNWLSERDSLRNETHDLREDLNRLESELASTHARIDELTAALWQPPGHFYSPIPDVKYLKSNFEKVFRFPERIPDLNINTEGQLLLLDQFQSWYSEQPFTATKNPGRRYYFENQNFAYTDGIVLYFMMRHLCPHRIIEVGSGFSSCAMLDVNDLLFDGNIDLTFIEPYPDLLLSLMHDEDLPRVSLLREMVQDVDLRIFEELGSNDVLFIDSSHVSKTGSDVNYLFFKVFPLLKEGVLIHIHDIFFPFEYPESFAFEGRAWNEIYLLHAFLAHNPNYRIEFFNTCIIHNFRKRIEAEFPLFLKGVGGSIWIRKVRSDWEGQE